MINSTEVYCPDMSPELINADEAARRLGIRPASLYAYVSRGVVRSHRLPGGRGSWFDPVEIEAMGRVRGRPRRAAQDLVISTSITRIDGRTLSYRGQDAATLCREASFESVAELLWSGDLSHERFSAPAPVLKAAREATRWLSGQARLADRLALAVAAAAASDPLRYELSARSVAQAGRSVIATMVDCLPQRQPHEAPRLVLGGRGAIDHSVAASLWPRLAAGPTPHRAAAVLNGFLVLLADHELATSTLAARLAASTRANPYSVVAAALGAMDGPLHGSASEEVVTLFAEASGPRGPVEAVAARLRRGQALPGFGHPLYPEGDPRWPAAMDLMKVLRPSGKSRLRIVETVANAVEERSGSAGPNVDFALGALAFLTDMPSDAGEAVFAIARTAGWLAHAIEEYGEEPLRYRARALYTGPGSSAR
jgi:citrate synthase